MNDPLRRGTKLELRYNEEGKPVHHYLIIMVTEISKGGGQTRMTPAPPPPPPLNAPLVVAVVRVTKIWQVGNTRMTLLGNGYEDSQNLSDIGCGTLLNFPKYPLMLKHADVEEGEKH